MRKNFHQPRQGLHTRPVFVIAFNQMPRGRAGAGLQQHLFHGFLVEGPLFAVAPVVIGEFPGFVMNATAFFEAAQLFIPRDVNPELYQNCAEILQLPLE